jgi:geranylgeranyl pyrophosphate synthase
VEKIAAVTAIYDRLEVRAECEKRVVELTQQALSYLSTLPQNAAADQLRQLADKLNTRKS